ncbi:MAG TPA: vWA domain-containing protein, partial [Candidatus Paceibacterota bacterium]
MTRPVSVLDDNIINHFVFVLDESGSMIDHRKNLVKVADRQIANLAEKSQKNGQETRVSIFSFSNWTNIKCLVWDKDVLRLPSIEKHYNPGGNTALVDAMMKSLDDVFTTSQIYGDHSFVFYLLTDGGENDSRKYRSFDLASRLSHLPENCTVAALVPGNKELEAVVRMGFHRGNSLIWDSTTEEGLERAHQSILQSADHFMDLRTTGVHSTKTLFDMSANAVNKSTIVAAGLTPLDTNEYILTTVVYDQRKFQDGDDWISTYTTNVLGHQYVSGRGFYQLTLAPVKVQIQKDIAIVEKKSGMVYTGKNARALLGLPENLEVTLRASQNPDYDIFIQSTSPNRKLLHGQKYLYLTPQITYTKGQSVVKPKAQPKVAQMPLSPKTVARRAAA